MAKDKFQIVLYGGAEGLKGDLAKVTGYETHVVEDSSCGDVECCGMPDTYETPVIEFVKTFTGGLLTILEEARRYVQREDKYENVDYPALNDTRESFEFTAERKLGVPDSFSRAKVLKALEKLGLEDVDKLTSVAFNFSVNRATVQGESYNAPFRLDLK